MVIGVGALSCVDRFNITLVANRQLCPDLEIFVDGVEHAVAALGDLVRPRA